MQEAVGRTIGSIQSGFHAGNKVQSLLCVQIGKHNKAGNACRVFCKGKAPWGSLAANLPNVVSLVNVHAAKRCVHDPQTRNSKNGESKVRPSQILAEGYPKQSLKCFEEVSYVSCKRRVDKGALMPLLVRGLVQPNSSSCLVKPPKSRAENEGPKRDLLNQHFKPHAVGACQNVFLINCRGLFVCRACSPSKPAEPGISSLSSSCVLMDNSFLLRTLSSKAD